MKNSRSTLISYLSKLALWLMVSIPLQAYGDSCIGTITNNSDRPWYVGFASNNSFAAFKQVQCHNAAILNSGCLIYPAESVQVSYTYSDNINISGVVVLSDYLGNFKGLIYNNHTSECPCFVKDPLGVVSRDNPRDGSFVIEKESWGI